MILRGARSNLQSLRQTQNAWARGVKARRLVQDWRCARCSSTKASPRKWSTPLAEKLAEAIKTTGPISIAAYMRQCLTSPGDGYYTSQTSGRDQFGQTGDFVTSPEISQIFGELLGIWIVAEWMMQGKKSRGVEILEMGPGRGTLMDDILRTIHNFKPMASSIESVYLIEASSSLRETQKRLLCGDDAPMEEIDIGFRSKSKYSDLPVAWCEDIRLLPNDPLKTPFIIAHEFFDALPIHAFQSVAPSPAATPNSTSLPGLSGPIEIHTPAPSASKVPQWRELVVTPVPDPPTSTMTTDSRPVLSKSSTPPLEFQLSLVKASNPSSLVLPERSSRYKALKNAPGSVIEISPEAQSYAAEFARRIGGTNSHHNRTPSNPQTPPPPPPTPLLSPKTNPSGAALIIDYGPKDIIPTSTLRGIRAHKLVSPFSSPGQVDISADVDFTALAEAAIEASDGIEVHGPVEQGVWLEEMGIRERAEMLIKSGKQAKVGAKHGNGEKGEDVREDEDGGAHIVRKAVERLVERGGGGMGRLYKVMAIVPERGGTRPVGFGGRID